MATFAEFGNEFINLDRVLTVEIKGHDSSGAVVQLTVTFTDGNQKHYAGPAADELLAYLLKTRVRP